MACERPSCAICISFDAAREAVTRIVRDHWKLFLIEGIILVVLGFLAIAVPMIAGLAVTILFGWLFLISDFRADGVGCLRAGSSTCSLNGEAAASARGVVGLITTFAMRHAPGFWWSSRASP